MILCFSLHAYTYSDSHLHLVNFLQEGDGIKAYLKAMDDSGVQDSMVSGMPFIKKWDAFDEKRPSYYLDNDSRVYWYSATDVLVAREVLSLPKKQQKRFHPFICGFNGTDLNAIDHVKRMMEWYPNFWEGIGEVMGRHDDLTALTYDETGRINHKALDAIYEFAGKHDLPVTIHSNISSVNSSTPLYINEVEDILKRHPKTRFIWSHAGISRRIKVPTLVSDLKKILTQYNNLWIDISWVVFEQEIYPNNQINRDWIGLIEAFPNRFMIGSDKVGRFGNYSSEIKKYDVLLDKLNPEIARKVARENFMSVLPKEKRN